MDKDFIQADSILVIRNDAVGDLTVTTPMFEALRKAYPKARIAALVAAENLEVVRENPFLDEILLDDYDHNVRGFRYLLKEIKMREFDVAFLAVPSLRMALALRMAGVPVRIGPATHLYNYLLLSKPVTQHRSRVEMHEADYNLSLLKKLGIAEVGDMHPFVKPSEPDVNWAREKLQQLKINTDQTKLIVIHPGMRGSSLNWPESHWQEMLAALQAESRVSCVVTGSNKDRPLIQRILSGSKDCEVPSLAGQTTLGQLIALLSLSHAFVGPSTGPMHLAAALKVHVFAPFSPIPVQSPKRWGPWKTDRKTVFVPPVTCLAKFRCLESKCAYHPCMPQIDPQMVSTRIRRDVLAVP